MAYCSFSSLYYIYAMVIIIMYSAIISPAVSSGLSPYYYDDICPEALPMIRRVVEDAVRQESRMGASLLRLHFHDCFVQVY